MTVDTGTSLGGRYELTTRIATGGMGEVWRARDTLLHRDVALKLLKPEYGCDPAFVERFRAEARHTAGLSHPGIAGVYDYGEDTDGCPYLVMELVDGEPLSHRLAREGRLDPVATLDLVAQAAAALHAAHEAGVIHRDVKPANILVRADGTVKITDFGIARAAGSAALTRTGTVFGTAHYLSPEQATGKEVTAASDVYSLGVVTYESLAGHRPFDHGSAVAVAMAHLHDEPPPLPPDVPEPVRMLVAQAMAKDPAERFATAAAFARAVAGVRERLDGTSAPPTMVLETPPPLPAVRSGPRRGVLIGIAAAVAVVVLALVVRAAVAPPPEHPVPPLAGQARDAAVAALRELNLDPVPRDEPSRVVAKGKVVRTDPAAGTVLREGDDVVLIVSSGPKPVALPGSLVGQDADDVVRRLRALELVVSRRSEQSREHDPGTVVRVEAAPVLVEGSAVTVVVAVEPEREKDDEKKGKGNDKDD